MVERKMETQLQIFFFCIITFSFSNFDSPGHIFKEVLTLAPFILHNAVNAFPLPDRKNTQEHS